MNTRIHLTLVALLFVSTEGRAQSLAGETFRGAFVTMTKAAVCPSTSTIAFKSQGEANGAVPGRFDDEGSMTLVFHRDASRLTLQAMSTTFTINASQVHGEFVSTAQDATRLQITCDPLTLRIDGRVTYKLTKPVAEEGLAEIRVVGSRRSILGPYYGNITVTFAPRR
jgi:hypothetical protein